MKNKIPKTDPDSYGEEYGNNSDEVPEEVLKDINI